MNAVLTIAIGDNYKSMARMTHSTLEAYAKKIGADFIVIDSVKISTLYPHFEKFQIFDLLNKYERILYVDTDAIIREDCPNLFEIVKPTHIGLFNEGGDVMDRSDAMKQVCQDYGEKIDDWQKQYYNTGVMVLSRHHKSLFKVPKKQIYNFYEQSYLNLRIIKDRIRVQELDYRFNRMCCMDKLTGEHRLKSYIIHYAGILNSLETLIPQDLARWKSGEYKNYKRHVVIGAGNNRLGDHVSIEPIVRYIVENSKDTECLVAAVYPEVFGHLKDKARICQFGNIKFDSDMPYLELNLAIDEDSPLKKAMTCDTMHMIDFSSIACLKRTLRDVDKQIKLPVTGKGFAEVLDVLNGKDIDLSKMVLVHPGKAWPSKTFPVPYWNEIIQGLSNKGIVVGIIGADGLPETKTGVLDVVVPENAIDFRNLLGLEALFALVSVAKVLVTNDSAPLHIAGAFDNHIVLIPTCKHPDFILPWRNGQKYHKVRALFKKLTCDNVQFDPSNLLNIDLSQTYGDLMDCLPDASEVVAVTEGLLLDSP